ncbi:CbrC family protein [Leptospira bandrabouensis]|uniref:CbrC family protein n=1 Tax=Leptospira bandrabouensis TaxID=2484903 RepID=UPI00223DD91C|nr:CbrC family protein [Leptospira bandrabouensis]MCW7460446.1 CbrC family protein [Leptospira bandrabouensis]MCW7479408.1 CbrC family protein [Leptospira bandrabouensis]MCW7487090.1 CbrC family protein [Leptospira bandrabouensis]
MNIPKFKYHPDPIKTGSIVPSDEICICCGQKSGYLYFGPVYTEADIEEQICPNCISNGLAHSKYKAEFTDIAAVGDYGHWDDVSESIKEEISYRTPSFMGWQQERWWTHCNDAGIFLGRAGFEEIKEYGNQLIEELKNECDINDVDWEEYFKALSIDDSPTAYVFQCIHCKKLGGYSDSH